MSKEIIRNNCHFISKKNGNKNIQGLFKKYVRKKQGFSKYDYFDFKFFFKF